MEYLVNYMEEYTEFKLIKSVTVTLSDEEMSIFFLGMKEQGRFITSLIAKCKLYENPWEA